MLFLRDSRDNGGLEGGIDLRVPSTLMDYRHQKQQKKDPQTSIMSRYLVIESYLVVKDDSVGLFRRWP